MFSRTDLISSQLLSVDTFEITDKLDYARHEFRRQRPTPSRHPIEIWNNIALIPFNTGMKETRRLSDQRTNTQSPSSGPKLYHSPDMSSVHTICLFNWLWMRHLHALEAGDRRKEANWSLVDGRGNGYAGLTEGTIPALGLLQTTNTAMI